MDLLSDGNADAIFEDVGFREGSTYLTVPATQLQLEVAVSNSGNAPVLEQVVNLAAGEHYTAVLLGEAASSSLQLVAILDDDDGIGVGNSRMTVVHAAPALGQINVFHQLSSAPAVLMSGLVPGMFETVELEADALTSLGFDNNDDSSPDAGFGTISPADISNQQVNAFISAGGPAGPNSLALVLQLPDGSLMLESSI